MGEEDEAVSRRSWGASEREALVTSLEGERRKNENLKRDMREVFDQKEELVTERDTLKTKHERLNKEMNLILNGEVCPLDFTT
jgi:predicted  nucleic acid-binding Zn-ribbon protein